LINFKPLIKDKLPEGIDSLQEVYFEWWLEELKEYGYVEKYNRCKRYKLIDNVFKTQLQHKPIKKDRSRHLLVEREFLKSWTYEPDYEIYWTDKSFNFLFKDIEFLYPITLKTIFNAKWIDGKWLSIVDIKPKSFRGGAMSSSVKFPLIQKMMYKEHDIYVHKISPLDKKGLFDLTFTPERYLLQDRRIINRKISKWKPISIKSFLEKEESVF